MNKRSTISSTGFWYSVKNDRKTQQAFGLFCIDQGEEPAASEWAELLPVLRLLLHGPGRHATRQGPFLLSLGRKLNKK